jgi:epoxide hydrolase-like predicted phosphatase
MTHPKIAAVVFDLDGVYFEHGTERFIEKLRTTYHLSPDAVKEVYLRSSQMQQYKRGEITGEEFWSYAIETWGISTTAEELLQFLADSYTQNPKVVELVHQLRKKGIKTAVCTNNFPERIAVLDKKFNFKKDFDVFITSYEEGVLKPQAQIFKIMAQRLGIEPAHIIMSDDKPENVEALQKLGFQSFLYVGFDDFKRRVDA